MKHQGVIWQFGSPTHFWVAGPLVRSILCMLQGSCSDYQELENREKGQFEMGLFNHLQIF